MTRCSERHFGVDRCIELAKDWLYGWTVYTNDFPSMHLLEKKQFTEYWLAKAEFERQVAIVKAARALGVRMGGGCPHCGYFHPPDGMCV